MHRLVGTALWIGMLASCAAPPPIATASDAARANIALAELEQGRTLLLGKCGGCHRPPLPASQQVTAWPKQVDTMAARSKITDEQHRLILQYLVTLAERPR